MYNHELMLQYLTSTDLVNWSNKTGIDLPDFAAGNVIYNLFENTPVNLVYYNTKDKLVPENSVVIKAGKTLNLDLNKYWTGISNLIQAIAETRQIPFRKTDKLYMWSTSSNSYYLASEGDVEEFPAITDSDNIEIVDTNGIIEVVEKTKTGIMGLSKTTMLAGIAAIVLIYMMIGKKKPKRKRRK